MKKVGIITMHRPLSFGSALQSYATLKVIRDFGFDAEIIDYKYPNETHIKNKGITLGKIKSFIGNMLFGFPDVKKRRKFEKFYKEFYKLSVYYPTKESLAENPPLYDIYVTGSDQVWNTNFIKDDTSFLLAFAPEQAKKVAFSSSFSHCCLDNQYVKMFTKYLVKYNHISVREESGKGIVYSLIGKNAVHVCDPTLLLEKEQWYSIEETSDMAIREPYILVFMLRYSFDPYPQARQIICEIQHKLNLKVIYLDGMKEDYFERNSHVIKNAGPSDFLHLIRNANYVITDSFHGTLFSALFNRPFTSIINPQNTDSRVMSFLKRIKMERNAVPFNTKRIVINERSSGLEEMEKFRMESLATLKCFLNN